LNAKTPISPSAQHPVYGHEQEQCSGVHHEMELSYVIDVGRDDPTRSLGAFTPGSFKTP